MFSIALVQMCSTPDLENNRRQVEKGVREGALRGASVVALPEGFLALGDDALKPVVASSIPGPVTDWLGSLARAEKVTLLAGGMPERAGEDLYMTAALINPSGEVVGTYRKIHLFDATLADGTSLRESASTRGGTQPLTVSTSLARMGLSICYDVRFPELYRRLAGDGAELVWVPSAFTAQTGAAHWHVLLRARAIENLCFVAAPAQVGEHGAGRRSYGHSLVVDPWGRVIAEGGDLPEVIVASIDLELLHRCRRQLPCLTHRRLG